MNELDFNQQYQKAVSVIKDPFKKGCVTDIDIHGQFKIFGNQEWYWYCIIQFSNGNTSGKQKTGEHAELKDLMEEVKSIVNSLNA